MQIALKNFHLIALEPRVCHASVVRRSSREIEQTLYVKITHSFFFFGKPFDVQEDGNSAAGASQDG
jgi:hypothetical protein